MDATIPRRRPPGMAALLAAVAVIAIAPTLMTGSGTHAQALAGAAGSGLAAAVAGTLIRKASRDEDAWPSGVGIAWAMFLIAAVSFAYLAVGSTSDTANHPRPADALLLLLLIPLTIAMRDELRVHFDMGDRREIAIDVMLIAASVGAILYLLIRPPGAGPTESGVAGVIAILAASQFTSFAALTLWVPTVSHLLQFLAFAGYAIATVLFGWMWTRGSGASGDPWLNAIYVLSPLLLAAVLTLVPHGVPVPRTKLRLARPILSSVSIVTACGALASVAVLGDSKAIGSLQSTLLIVLLGGGIAARVVANQVASTQAHQTVEEALTRRETALREADLALERVRETNETIRRSEEHLRLVFDAAVDGFVELDEDDVVVRANEAFAGMVGMDRAAIEGQPWSVVAASVQGSDASFARLPETGQANIQRPEGQPLFIESRISQVPTDPPRRLLLARDVTSAKVADQTIRSLFQFLQDRDEDRTRLLRRTNSAIEQERNRIARDLHDGPVQGVSAASLSLEAALLMIKTGDVDRGLDVLTKIRQELAEEADSLRRLMAGLRPPVLEERGLMPALRESLMRFGTDQGVATEFTGSITRPIPDDLETLAFRIVQESLTNVGKHAAATRVIVHVESDQSQLRIEVEDDGTGFETTEVRDHLRAGRVGLASMRERVELASGTFAVRSTPGRGTAVMASIPLDLALVTAVPQT
jgi:PAS domain S-box-containing protein